MKLFSVLKLLSISLVVFKLNAESIPEPTPEPIPDFCKEKPKIDAITQLSNGFLLLTSGSYYWVLKKDKQIEGFYENPTNVNCMGLISIQFTGFKRIDSIVRFSTRIGLTQEVCGDEAKGDLLMVYWFDEHKKSPIIKFYLNWIEVEHSENNKLINAITQKSDQIDWKTPLDASLSCKTSNQIFYEVYQKGKCSKRICDKKWEKYSKCPPFQIDSIFCESSANQIAMYGFSGERFIECRGKTSRNLKCNPEKETAFDFFHFDRKICKKGNETELNPTKISSIESSVTTDSISTKISSISSSVTTDSKSTKISSISSSVTTDSKSTQISSQSSVTTELKSSNAHKLNLMNYLFVFIIVLSLRLLIIIS